MGVILYGIMPGADRVWWTRSAPDNTQHTCLCVLPYRFLVISAIGKKFYYNVSLYVAICV